MTTPRIFASSAAALVLLLSLAGCASAEEYRSRTSTETARAANEPAPAAADAPPAPAPNRGDEPGLGHRAKPFCYSLDRDRLFLGVDASQARVRVEWPKERYLPLGVLIANRGRVDLALRDASWSYRPGVEGEWQALPEYAQIREGATVSDTLYERLAENDPFSLSFDALDQVTYSPYPRPGGGIRIESTALPTMRYAHFMAWIPSPGMTGAGGVHQLRYRDSERGVELVLGFRLLEPKRK